MKQIIAIFTVLLLAPMPAAAVVPIPEPGMLPLLTVGGLVALAIYLKRRK
ncbi:MAG: PEP-CTERM sorting domain-containing protein [Gammaproteobacteria bacterium]